MSFVYNRNIQKICLKLTGESLMKEGDSLSPRAITHAVNQIKLFSVARKQLCIVVGGGNFYRGSQGGDIAPLRGDYIGMLATVMNSLALGDALLQEGLESEIFSAFPIGNIVEPFNAQKAKQAMIEGKIVLFCAGIGHPHFTTDTASALRAIEMEVDVVLKATKVDGIYTKDPSLFSSAKKIPLLSYNDVLENGYKVMDMSAFLLCKEKNIPIIIYDFFDPTALSFILEGNIVGTLVTSESEKELLGIGE